MDSREYTLGECFRCDRTIQVTRVGEIISTGSETPLYACAPCTGHLAAMHAPAHESLIRAYVLRARPH